MVMNSGSASVSSSDRPEAPRLYASLPAPADDLFAVFDRCLIELMDLLGLQHPQVASESSLDRYRWQGRSRSLIAKSLRGTTMPDEWFEALLRAAVHDPNPSFNRQLIEPALDSPGRRRVQLALLEYLKTGSDAERAGAARAWYWAQVARVSRAGSSEPAQEGSEEYEANADLRREWRDSALQVFLTNENLDVRRNVIALLDLRVEGYPQEQRAAVEQAIRIARTHPDEYLRHRVEHQVEPWA